MQAQIKILRRISVHSAAPYYEHYTDEMLEQTLQDILAAGWTKVSEGLPKKSKPDSEYLFRCVINGNGAAGGLSHYTLANSHFDIKWYEDHYNVTVTHYREIHPPKEG